MVQLVKKHRAQIRLGGTHDAVPSLRIDAPIELARGRERCGGISKVTDVVIRVDPQSKVVGLHRQVEPAFRVGAISDTFDCTALRPRKGVVNLPVDNCDLAVSAETHPRARNSQPTRCEKGGITEAQSSEIANDRLMAASEWRTWDRKYSREFVGTVADLKIWTAGQAKVPCLDILPIAATLVDNLLVEAETWHDHPYTTTSLGGCKARLTC